MSGECALGEQSSGPTTKGILHKRPIIIRSEVTMGQIKFNRAGDDEERSGPTLVIDGRVLMGGVEITD